VLGVCRFFIQFYFLKFADVIDFDEYASGQRKEGAYSAAFGFALKSGAGLKI
jgi:Na+/melibiose symporter-like transporter